MRLGGARGRCPRAPKAGAPRRGGGPGGGGGGSQAGGKAGGDYPPHMDATLKGPPVPSTPDILSSLSRRGISDLSVAVPRRALRHRQRRRISSRPPSLLVLGSNRRRTRRRTSFPSASPSPTCLSSSSLRPLRLAAAEVSPPPTSSRRRLLGILGGAERHHPRGLFVAAGSETTTLSGNCRSSREPHATTPLIARTEGEFFTHSFAPRGGGAFDARSTTARHYAEQRRRPLLTAVVLRVGHIDRLRPQAPNSKVQPKTLREQCRAALPRGLCKVSDLLSSFIERVSRATRGDESSMILIITRNAPCVHDTQRDVSVRIGGVYFLHRPQFVA